MPQSKPFRFTHTFSQKVVRDLKIVEEYLDVEVSGSGKMHKNFSCLEIDERFSADIDFVIWKGKDVKELIEFMGCLEEVQEAALRAVANLFTNQLSAA
jgi:hypothetical protein